MIYYRVWAAGDEELEALRARLAETERAMQRIVGQLAKRDAVLARAGARFPLSLNQKRIQIALQLLGISETHPRVPARASFSGHASLKTVVYHQKNHISW